MSLPTTACASVGRNKVEHDAQAEVAQTHNDSVIPIAFREFFGGKNPVVSDDTRKFGHTGEAGNELLLVFFGHRHQLDSRFARKKQSNDKHRTRAANVSCRRKKKASTIQPVELTADVFVIILLKNNTHKRPHLQHVEHAEVLQAPLLRVVHLRTLDDDRVSR